jgi:hypothetical protein
MYVRLSREEAQSESHSGPIAALIDQCSKLFTRRSLGEPCSIAEARFQDVRSRATRPLYAHAGFGGGARLA